MLDSKTEVTFVTAGKETVLLLEKTNLGPFKNYKVVALSEMTEQEMYS